MTINPQHPDFRQAVDWLQSAERIVVFTGAGISAASGIATFRDSGGFWRRFPPDEFANWKGLIEKALLQPQDLAEFLIAVIEPIASAKPNAAHIAIAQLAKHRSVDVVTQNIDRLHQEAGSECVHEIHGSLFDIVSFPQNEHVSTLSKEELKQIVDAIQVASEQAWTGLNLLKAIAPLLSMSLKGAHRPNLVLFGDQLAEPDWTKANQAVENCDLLISIGTSESVYPAAGLPSVAKRCGARTITIDPEARSGDLQFSSNAEDFLPDLVDAAFMVEGK